MKPRVAIVSFPGTNNEVESVRAVNRAGMEAHCFKWNDDASALRDMDAYFLVGGFSYEDRGRSGMVAARDPIMKILREESEKGKVIIGHCNGAQILIESGLVPLGKDLRMSLAHNAVKNGGEWTSPGFINEWIWIKPVCAKDRCATSDWSGPMHIPIAHGEGRYVTKDPDVITELEKNDQIAFKYCDKDGKLGEDLSIVPNGSTLGIAGICNPSGNVVALMPHPERTENGSPYFESLARWLSTKHEMKSSEKESEAVTSVTVPSTDPKDTEIFIDTIIVNNEERTVEQAAHRIVPSLKLKQYRYLAPTETSIEELLSTISVFNPNKEIAYVRKNGELFRWNAKSKALQKEEDSLFRGIALVSRAEPDTKATHLGKGSETGMCYDCAEIDEQKLYTKEMLEIFGNPHASSLHVLG